MRPQIPEGWLEPPSFADIGFENLPRVPREKEAPPLYIPPKEKIAEIFGPKPPEETTPVEVAELPPHILERLKELTEKAGDTDGKLDLGKLREALGMPPRHDITVRDA